MLVASTPLFQEFRLQDLYRYDILDSESEQDFDDLLAAAAHIYRCPMAAISFIDEKRQWIKSAVGIERGDSSLETAFCTHTILGGDVMVINDTLEDERFHDNPLVTGGPGIRFYAGVPVVSQAGYRLGTICVFDNNPRTDEGEEFNLLEIMSRQISKLLDLRLQKKQLRQQAETLLSVEKDFLRQTLQQIEDQRFAVGSALHENIAQGLVATRFYLELAGDADMARDQLIEKSRLQIEAAIAQIRDLAHSLVPSTLKEYNLHELLHHLASRFYNSSGIEVSLDYKGSHELHPDVTLALYRIVEAGLDNVQRHSGARKARISVDVSATVQLRIEDDGCGIDMAGFRRGAGLQSVLLRAENFGGTLDIGPGTMGGCGLVVSLSFLKPAPTGTAASKAGTAAG